MSLPANIRVNTQFPFPALVRGSGPIGIGKLQGVWTINLSSTGLTIIPEGADLTNKDVLIYDTAIGLWQVISMETLIASLVIPPSFTDLTVTGSFTATGLVHNASLSNAAAYTFKGNPTGSSAAPSDFTIAGLTHKASPAGSDLILISDEAASHATKYATIAEAIGSIASGVSSWNSRTGAVVLAQTDLGMAARNVAINGAMDVSQENGTSAVGLTSGVLKYTADGWQAYYNHAAATAVVSVDQRALPGFAPLAGFQYGELLYASTAISSPASGDCALYRQNIEGYRIAHWGWGASGASSIVIAFQLYSLVSGVAFVRLSNSDATRLYYHEITVAAGWNFYAFTVPGDTSGTWNAMTGIGLTFDVFVSGKEGTPASVLNTWGTTVKVQTTNSTNLLGTNGNFTMLTGVYIDVGTHLPVAADLPLLMRPFGNELSLCKRYWQKTFPYATAPADNAGSTGALIHSTGTFSTGAALNMNWLLSTPMRAAPAVTTYNPFNTGAGLASDIYNAGTPTYALGVLFTSDANVQLSSAVTAGTSITPGIHAIANARL